MELNNFDKSDSNVCKEDVLMCIFKEVPNFAMDEDVGADGLVGESHHEVVVGRTSNATDAGATSSTLIEDNDSEEREVTKSIMNCGVGQSSQELILWSCPIQDEETILEGATCLGKPRKKRKLRNKDFWRVVREIFPSDSVQMMGEREISSFGNLCQDSQVSTELVSCKSKGDVTRNSSGTSMIALPSDSRTTMCTHNQVMKLLNEAHTSIIESNILLTTHRLHKKAMKKKDLERDTPSDCDVLFHQIQAEEGVEEGTSKLCLLLGKMVEKYLKVK